MDNLEKIRCFSAKIFIGKIITSDSESLIIHSIERKENILNIKCINIYWKSSALDFQLCLDKINWIFETYFNIFIHIDTIDMKWQQYIGSL